jgi:hypothetical protein
MKGRDELGHEIIRSSYGKTLIPTLPQPPIHFNSPLPTFFLFPKHKITFKGRSFQTVEDVLTYLRS